MCRPTDAAPSTCRVVISGAGPAGLLLQALLHRRNGLPDARVEYHVTLIESRPDYGTLNQTELAESHRSWMIGLAGHGLEALRSVPGLYEKYVSDIGVKIDEGAIYFGSKKISMGGAGGTDKDAETMGETFVVDRNFIVAALARYARDNMFGSPLYEPKYETELLYVDHANRRVLIRDVKTETEEYVPYDLLVGADGARSTVRDAMSKRHFDFECQLGDIFQTFKAVHIKRPESVSPTSLSLLPNCLPSGFTGISLPETSGVINVSMGVPRNRFDSIDDELKSDDPKVVAKYIKDNFKAFQLSDDVYMDWATQWVNQRWNRTGQVYCNKYTSTECKLVLMGDAAHATSPSIGMGMNTALRDAQKFVELLNAFDDDLDRVLPQYSVDRVPEGNALTNLAMNLYCFDERVQMISILKSTIRSGLHRFFPSLVGPDPQLILGQPNYTLSDVYDIATKQGILARHRAINLRIRQEFFERETGMVKKEKETTKTSESSWMKRGLVVAPVASLAVAMFVRHNL